VGQARGVEGGGIFHSLVLLEGPGVLSASEMSLLALLVLAVINIVYDMFVELDTWARI
jgi:hypothetical protein